MPLRLLLTHNSDAWRNASMSTVMPLYITAVYVFMPTLTMHPTAVLTAQCSSLHHTTLVSYCNLPDPLGRCLLLCCPCCCWGAGAGLQEKGRRAAQHTHVLICAKRLARMIQFRRTEEKGGDGAIGVQYSKALGSLVPFHQQNIVAYIITCPAWGAACACPSP